MSLIRKYQEAVEEKAAAGGDFSVFTGFTFCGNPGEKYLIQ